MDFIRSARIAKRAPRIMKRYRLPLTGAVESSACTVCGQFVRIVCGTHESVLLHSFHNDETMLLDNLVRVTVHHAETEVVDQTIERFRLLEVACEFVARFGVQNDIAPCHVWHSIPRLLWCGAFTLPLVAAQVNDSMVRVWRNRQF